MMLTMIKISRKLSKRLSATKPGHKARREDGGVVERDGVGLHEARQERPERERRRAGARDGTTLGRGTDQEDRQRHGAVGEQPPVQHSQNERKS